VLNINIIINMLSIYVLKSFLSSNFLFIYIFLIQRCLKSFFSFNCYWNRNILSYLHYWYTIMLHIFTMLLIILSHIMFPLDFSSKENWLHKFFIFKFWNYQYVNIEKFQLQIIYVDIIVNLHLIRIKTVARLKKHPVYIN